MTAFSQCHFDSWGHQITPDGKGYKPVYMFLNPGGVIKHEDHWTWEVERSSAGTAGDHDDYVVKKFLPVGEE